MSFWMFVVLIVLLVTGGDLLSRWMDRREPRLPAGTGEREVRELREQVEDLSRQVQRLSEEQRFLTRLLEERPGGADEASEPGTFSGRASQ